MSENRLHLTDLGLQAANNASAGGVFINLTHFQLGNGSTPPQDSDDSLAGSVIYQGAINYVEVHSEHASTFVLDIPEYAVSVETEVTEIVVNIDNGVVFARCVFDAPIILEPGIGTRLRAVLVTNRCNLTVINVTVGDYSSVPATPHFWSLPSPVASQHNVISVLNGQVNADGSMTPVCAMRFGAGNFEWAFSGYERVYSGTVTPTATGFDAPLVGFQNDEMCVAHVKAGSGLASTRRFRFSTAQSAFIELDGKPFAINGSSIVSVWKRTDGGNIMVGSCQYPPQMTNIPEDYVLTRGLGNCPVWAPPKQTANLINTLYVSPGKLKVNRVAYTGNDRENRFIVPNVVLPDVNNVYVAVGAVSQHRSAFDVSGSEVEFSENIPGGALVDIRAFTKIPGTGTYLELVSDHYTGDGNTLRYALSTVPESIDDTFMFIRGALQSHSSYTYDAVTNELVTAEPVDGGLDVEIVTLRHRQRDGYSTKIITTSFVTYGQTLFFELPVYPQSKEHVWISVSGTHIHGNLYNIVDNKVVLQGPIPTNLEVECFIFHNVKAEGTETTNLRGLVTGATLTHKALRLHRHDEPDMVLRIPALNIEAGRGMRVTGTHPNLKIESTVNEQITSETVFKYNTLERKDNAEEIIYTKRIELTADLLLQVTCDFSAELGPGFLTSDGNENIEYVIGFRTSSIVEPDYGRQIRGTGKAGFSIIKEGLSEFAYANSSMTQSYTIEVANIPSRYIDIVCKMRIRNAAISRYESQLFLNINIMGFPKI